MLTSNVRERPSIQQVIAQVEQLMHGQQQQPGFPAQQQGPGQQQAALGGRLPGGAAMHERAPSQGWADFGASGASSPLSPAMAGSNSSGPGAREHRRAGSSHSGSWASFSPTKADDGQPAASAAVAGAGSFWSSFGEEMPLEANGSAGVSNGSQQQGPPSRMHHRDEPSQPAAAAADASATSAALLQRHQPSAPVRPPPVEEVAEVSPLSSGLLRMTVGNPQGPGQAASHDAQAARPASSAGKQS